VGAGFINNFFNVPDNAPQKIPQTTGAKRCQGQLEGLLTAEMNIGLIDLEYELQLVPGKRKFPQ